MKRIITLVLLLAVAISTALAQEQDKEKRLKDLEKKIDELMMDIEIMKATSGTEEQKVEKFKMFGYYGARFQDMNYESKSVGYNGNPMYGTSTAGKIYDQPSFVQNNLNIYFQFNPIEDFRMLTEIRFLYFPAGITNNTELDKSTLVPFSSNKFYSTDPTTGNRTWFPSNGTLYFNHPVNGLTNIQIGYVGLPINKDGSLAVRASQTAVNIPTGQFIDPVTGQPTTTPTSMPIYLQAGTWVPVDTEGNYILSSGGKYVLFSKTGAMLGYTTSASIVFTDTPLMKSATLRENRVENYFLDPTSAHWGQYGSINIERAFMEWTPNDHYGFKLGKFFTPFGIWNVDHGTPVLMTARVPYFLTFLPETQMGFEVAGKYNFPHTDLDYSLYISNGRGLIKEMEENNDEKSVGGRLALKLQMPIFKELAIGASGYYGKHDEKTTQFALNYDYTVTPDGVTINGDGTDANLQSEYKTITQFDEMLIGLDLKAIFQDFSFQSEFMYRKWDFTAFDTEYFHKWASFYYPPTQKSLEEVTTYYVQGAYKLPWEYKGVAVTPFVRWEKIDGFIKSKGYFSTGDDTGYKNIFNILSLGLNIRQNPYVVYKLDYTATKFDDRDRLNFNIFTACADIAF